MTNRIGPEILPKRRPQQWAAGRGPHDGLGCLPAPGGRMTGSARAGTDPAVQRGTPGNIAPLLFWLLLLQYPEN